MMKKLAGLFLIAFAMAVVGCGGPGKPEIPTEGPKRQTDPVKGGNTEMLGESDE